MSHVSINHTPSHGYDKEKTVTRDMSQEADSCFIVNADSMRHSIPVSGSHVGTGQSGGGKCHKFTL